MEYEDVGRIVYFDPARINIVPHIRFKQILCYLLTLIVQQICHSCLDEMRQVIKLYS